MSPNNSENATTDVQTRMKNDFNWNSFSKNITYTCPDGFVMEMPGNNSEQTLDITQFNVRCDADAYWRPVIPSNPYPELPVMPRCIGRFILSKMRIITFHIYI